MENSVLNTPKHRVSNSKCSGCWREKKVSWFPFSLPFLIVEKEHQLHSGAPRSGSELLDRVCVTVPQTTVVTWVLSALLLFWLRVRGLCILLPPSCKVPAACAGRINLCPQCLCKGFYSIRTAMATWSTMLILRTAPTPHSQARSQWKTAEGFKCWQILWLLCLGDGSRYECPSV